MSVVFIEIAVSGPQESHFREATLWPPCGRSISERHVPYRSKSAYYSYFTMNLFCPQGLDSVAELRGG